MSAVGELLIYIIYFALGITYALFLLLTFICTKSTKILTCIATLLFAFLILKFQSCQKENYKQNQLDQVGFYELTAYPNCTNCMLELKEDQTYEVKKNGQVIEHNNWHYEVGGDYWITYLNNDNHKLGNGKFLYRNFKQKFVKP